MVGFHRELALLGSAVGLVGGGLELPSFIGAEAGVRDQLVFVRAGSEFKRPMPLAGMGCLSTLPLMQGSLSRLPPTLCSFICLAHMAAARVQHTRLLLHSPLSLVCDKDASPRVCG